MNKALSFISVVVFLIAGCHAGCDLVESQTYSTGDVLLSSETVFIVELELKCTGTEAPTLHSLVNGQLLSVSRTIGANKYQLSWSQQHDEAKTGRTVVNFYDEEASTAIRKALRYGEEISTKPTISVNLDHKGARSGLLLAPSFIAVVVAVLVWYMAYNTKLKLQE